MSADMQRILDEIQKLSANTDRQFEEVNTNLNRRFTDMDESLDQRFQEAALDTDRRICDSELRQDERLKRIELAATEFVDWRAEQEGVLDDLRLRVNKLDRFWTRAVVETGGVLHEAAVLTELYQQPQEEIHYSDGMEQYAAPTSACYQAARPSGHRVDNNHREDGHGSVTALVHSFTSRVNQRAAQASPDDRHMRESCEQKN